MMMDLHCDTLSRITEKGEGLWQNSGQWDVWRARVSGMAMQILALFVDPAKSEDMWKELGRQMDVLHRQLEEENLQSTTVLVKNAEDMEPCLKDYRLGLLLHLEGGDAIGKRLERLESLREAGLRSLGLTWNWRNLLGDGAMEPMDGGLTAYGREFIREMNERHILLDLTHASEKTFAQALETTQRTAYVSHANAAKLCRHPRNLKDEQIKAVAQQGGIIGLTYYREFLTQEKVCTMDMLIDHMVYIAELVGCEALALGSDFDGAEDMVVQDITATAYLNRAMEKRGFYPAEIEQILGGNALRFLKENL